MVILGDVILLSMPISENTPCYFEWDRPVPRKSVTVREFSIERSDTKKTKGSLGNVGIMGFVFTNFQADNYGTSSGGDEGNCVYN